MRRALEPADYPFFDYRRFTFSLGVETSKGIWLAGSTAVYHDNITRQMIVRGDLVDQADLIYQKMAKTLAAAHLDTYHIIHLVQYVTPAALPDLEKLAALHRIKFLGEKLPSIQTIVVKRLLRDEALIEIEALASRTGESPVLHLPAVQAQSAQEAQGCLEQEMREAGCEQGRVLRTLCLRSAGFFGERMPTAPTSGAFSEVIVPCLPDRSEGFQTQTTCARSGDVIYASASGDASLGGIVEQTRDAYARLEKSLKAAGAGFADVVKTTEFITPAGLKDYRGTADVRRQIFDAPYPAATGVICEALPDTGSQILVEAVAVMEHV